MHTVISSSHQHSMRTPFSSESGKIDYDVLHRNLSTPTDVYIQRRDGAPCGHTKIHLYRGAQCDQGKRENLLMYLKGSRDQRGRLEKENPNLFAHFEKVWGVTAHHLVPKLPSQYIIFFAVATILTALIVYVKVENQTSCFSGIQVVLLFPYLCQILLIPGVLQTVLTASRTAVATSTSLISTWLISRKLLP